jgi:NADH-quinone oxidoreductase subunit N
MGKLFIFNAAVNADLVWLAVIGVLNSVVSAYYYVGVIRVMYLRDPSDDEPIGVAKPLWTALWVAAFGVLALGVWPAGLLDIAREAALNLR